MRDENGEWVGSLAQIGWQQLLGYWVNSTESLEFSFVIPDEIGRYINNNIPDDYKIPSNPIDFVYNQRTLINLNGLYFHCLIEID